MCTFFFFFLQFNNVPAGAAHDKPSAICSHCQTELIPKPVESLDLHSQSLPRACPPKLLVLIYFLFRFIIKAILVLRDATVEFFITGAICFVVLLFFSCVAEGFVFSCPPLCGSLLSSGLGFISSATISSFPTSVLSARVLFHLIVCFAIHPVCLFIWTSFWAYPYSCPRLLGTPAFPLLRLWLELVRRIILTWE